jgi:uncharacterized protein with HEPN domain
MNHNPEVCIYDAVSACGFIIEFTADISFEAYLDDARTRFAVERQFEILGESLNRLKKLAPDLLDNIHDWKEVISFRNIIIHGYDNLNDGIVFDTAKNDVPRLFKELSDLLEKSTGRQP